MFSVSTLVDNSRGNYPPDEWLADWPVRTLVDSTDSSAARAYGLESTPFWVFVDAEGKVVGRASGTIAPSDLAERLEELAA